MQNEFLHRTLDISPYMCGSGLALIILVYVEGWAYLNGYMNVETKYGETDIALRQRSLRLIYSGPMSSASNVTPRYYWSLMFVIICIVVWKITLN